MSRAVAPAPRSTPLTTRGTRWTVSALMLALVLGGVTAATSDSGGYTPSLSGPDRLLTNEYAHHNPDQPRSRMSRDWEVSSGSLFVRGHAGWTGVPDAAAPDALSGNGTGSSVFRATTRRRDFGDAAISVRLRNNGLTDDGRNPPADTDGIHVFLRWKSPSELYVVSLNRRDDKLVVKKKTPGGPVNGGTYVTLAQAPYAVPYGDWQNFSVRIITAPGGAVVISVSGDRGPLLSLLDDDDDRVLGMGAVGLRGDNCDFEFAGMRITAADVG